MTDPPSAPPGRGPLLAGAALAVAVAACSAYANLSFAVTDPADFRYFPPFQPHVNANRNDHLGGEYVNVAQALLRGRGYADPFGEPTGPTAWVPPLLPALLAGLLWASGGSRGAVTAVVVVLQVGVLIGTGLLVLALARRTTRRLGPGVAAGVYFAGLLGYFRLCFQYTHDSWLVLLALDGLLAGLCWGRPLGSWRTAAGWGLFGGLCALVGPVVGLAWAGLSLAAGLRQRAWLRLALAGLVAGLTLAPWTARNVLVLGRLVPVKSNLAYELYQSQCLQPGGVLTTFAPHPYTSANPERQEYEALGEAAYMDRKREQFWQAVRADPGDFLRRVGTRFVAATLWYETPGRAGTARRPWAVLARGLTRPLPFLALLVLLATAVREPLSWPQWVVIAVYLLYLLPYVAASYYDRYAVPLMGVKALLVIWAADRLLSWRYRPAKGG